MKVLLYSSPTYTDDNAVGSWLQSIATQSAGEVVTVTIHGGASETARRIIEGSPDSGLEWDRWHTEIMTFGGDVIHWAPDDLWMFDEIIYLWESPDREERIVTVARNLGIPLLEHGDALISERQI